MKTLVVYYSRTGNTKYVAEKIAENLAADTCEVIDKKSRKGRLGFVRGGYESIRKKLTEIELSKTVDNYDLLIIGSPVWANGIAPAIRTFINQNNLSNKKIASFVTLKGNDPTKAFDSLKEAIFPNESSAELGITNDLKNREEVENQIIDWCKEITEQIIKNIN
jgi:flavodoxin